MENELDLLRKKHDQTVKHYNFLLSQRERAYAEQMLSLAETYRGSWKWRIGSLVVDNFIIGLNFFRNPIRFIKDQSYRTTWQGYNFRTPYEAPKPIPMVPVEMPEESKLPVKPKDPKPEEGKKSQGNQETKRETAQQSKGDVKPAVEFFAAAVLEESTELALGGSLPVMTCRPDNWRERYKDQLPGMLIVESARRGNRGAWQYQLNLNNTDQGAEITALTSWARQLKIPSFFWFTCAVGDEAQYYAVASQFDHILVSDTRQRDRLNQIADPSRIVAMPYALQPKIFNPLSSSVRERALLFPVRLNSITSKAEQEILRDHLLVPSAKSDLRVLDSMYGDFIFNDDTVKHGLSQQTLNVGRLAHRDMAAAYRRYMVSLHFQPDHKNNSRISRHIYESLGCGTPVISNYSPYLEGVFGDIIHFTDSPDATRNHLDRLMNDDFAWRTSSLKGLRNVLFHHRFDLRVDELLNVAGLPPVSKPMPRISLLVYLTCNEHFQRIVEMAGRQSYPPHSIILISEEIIPKPQLDWYAGNSNGIALLNFSFYQNNLAKIISDAVQCEYYAVWSPEAWYGSNYLLDYVLATRFSAFTLFGKANYFNFAGGKLMEVAEGNAYGRSASVPVSTLVLHKERLASFNFLLLMEHGSRFYSFEADIQAMDSMNYLGTESQLLSLDASILSSVNV